MCKDFEEQSIENMSIDELTEKLLSSIKDYEYYVKDFMARKKEELEYANDWSIEEIAHDINNEMNKAQEALDIIDKMIDDNNSDKTR